MRPMRSHWLRGQLEPDYLTPSGPVDLTIKGTAGGPLSHPMGVITVTPGGRATYERLFCDLSADGSPVGYYYPGTFAPDPAPAGRGFRW